MLDSMALAKQLHYVFPPTCPSDNGVHSQIKAQNAHKKKIYIVYLQHVVCLLNTDLSMSFEANIVQSFL